ncbi:MAG TPA: DUF488 domain-containing protein [Pyrinomonadaceae bacterium]|jgi:uncharacterized protein (DUF488 family)|nr:DUF488 domain-containing protein [Pyrinomonadaceae bacterium]
MTQELLPSNPKRTDMADKLSIWTVGHSTLSIEDFIAQLRAVEIELLADVRSFPGSRRYPHFNKENLSLSLADAAIGYRHLRELGGRRRARPDSLNLAWRNESFRGYADYMETKEFGLGIEKLLGLATESRVAIMCSEAVWWRCHRSMISDYLKVKGIDVLHLMGRGKTEAHPFTAAARVVNGELSYRGVLSE